MYIVFWSRKNTTRTYTKNTFLSSAHHLKLIKRLEITYEILHILFKFKLVLGRRIFAVNSVQNQYIYWHGKNMQKLERKRNKPSCLSVIVTYQYIIIYFYGYFFDKGNCNFWSRSVVTELSFPAPVTYVKIYGT